MEVKQEKIRGYSPDLETSAKLLEAEIKSGFKSEIGLAVMMFPPMAFEKKFILIRFYALSQQLYV